MSKWGCCEGLCLSEGKEPNRLFGEGLCLSGGVVRVYV